MSQLTILQASKLFDGEVYRRGVIAKYAESSSVLAALPFETIAGNTYSYTRTTSFGTQAFRGVNEDYTAGNGDFEEVHEPLKISGGSIEIDNFLLLGNNSIRSTLEAAKIEGMALAWTKNFVKGDNTTNVKEFNGLQARATGDQEISAGSTANGAALSLYILDQAIAQTDRPTHLLMSKQMRNRLTQAARNTSVGGYLSETKDAFGRTVLMFNDLPILTVDLDHNGDKILGFTEAAASGTDTASSIYVLSLGGDGVIGLQSSPPVIAYGEMGVSGSLTKKQTLVEWYSTIANMRTRAITRLRNIGDLAFVA